MKKNQPSHVIDATGKAFGRVASMAAHYLQGKHVATYTKNATEVADVTVNNLLRVTFSGKKISQKKYYKHSSYPGGMKVTSLQAAWQKNPKGTFRKAVERMLPKNRLKKPRLNHLLINE